MVRNRATIPSVMSVATDTAVPVAPQDFRKPAAAIAGSVRWLVMFLPSQVGNEIGASVKHMRKATLRLLIRQHIEARLARRRTKLEEFIAMNVKLNATRAHRVLQ